jgi:hypothetical protein
MEVAHLIMRNFKEDIKESDRILALLHDLEDIRMDRMRIGIESTAKMVIDGRRVDLVQV